MQRAMQSGLLACLGPAVFLALRALHHADALPLAGLPLSWVLALLPALGISIGAWILECHPMRGRVITTTALLLGFGLAGVALVEAPGVVFVLLLALTSSLVWLWSPPSTSGPVRLTGKSERALPAAPRTLTRHARRSPQAKCGTGERVEAPMDSPLNRSPDSPLGSPSDSPRQRRVRARAAICGALVTWLVGVPLGLGSDLAGQLAVGAAFGLAVARIAVAPLREPAIWRLPRSLVLILAMAGAVLPVLAWRDPVALLSGLTVPSLLLLLLSREPRSSLLSSSLPWWGVYLERPALLLTITFLGTCVLGGLLLSLPFSATQAWGISPLDALFTAVSATCVTGLIVLDTPQAFSPIGQTIILMLIQVGGLGIMTFSTAALIITHKRLSLRHEQAAAEILGSDGRGGLVTALRRVLVITFVAEGIGAALLTALFVRIGDAVPIAAWRGLFTAISAYCNAGFALQSDSLIAYQLWPSIIHVVGVLVILGGLGPVVLAEVPSMLRGRRGSLHARLVLTVSAVLLVGPALLIIFLEWHNTLTGLPGWERLTSAWFQSVTARTAGFNAVDMSTLHPATLTLTQALMFVGGSPGSTAGGIKTTTFALLFLVIVGALRGRDEISVFGWRLPSSSLYRAVAIFTLGVLAIFAATLALQLTQALAFPVALFEVISALGTVGLSIGGTEQLDGIGKIIVMVVMFAGRVGPLTLFLALFQEQERTPWNRPTQEVAVG